MRVTDELSLGHSGVDSLCSATQSNFVETVTDSISHNIKQSLSESGITDETHLSCIKMLVTLMIYSVTYRHDTKERNNFYYRNVKH